MSKKLLFLGLSLLSVASINLVACQNAAPSNALVIGMECAYQPFNWTQKNANEFTLPIDGYQRDQHNPYPAAANSGHDKQPGSSHG